MILLVRFSTSISFHQPQSFVCCKKIITLVINLVQVAISWKLGILFLPINLVAGLLVGFTAEIDSLREAKLKFVAPLKEVIIGLSAPEGGCIWPGSLLNWSACLVGVWVTPQVIAI